MLRRNAVPPDTFPDEFDSPAYRNYRPSLRPSLLLSLRGILPTLLVIGTMLLVVAVGFVAALLILPEAEPKIVVISIYPSPTPPGDITGDFPATIQQASITLPARIDEAIGVGEPHGYRFFAGPGLIWVITLLTDGGFTPRLTLYNPDGTVSQITDGQPITFTAPEIAQYGLLIEPSTGAGGYTLRIFPQ